jgi:hypothetical protein
MEEGRSTLNWPEHLFGFGYSGRNKKGKTKNTSQVQLLFNTRQAGRLERGKKDGKVD